MTRDVRLHPLATAEVVKAQLGYDDCVPALGVRLFDAVRATTERAARWPNAGTSTRQDVVVYRVASEDLEILAVHHGRRRPIYWAGRVTE